MTTFDGQDDDGSASFAIERLCECADILAARGAAICAEVPEAVHLGPDQAALLGACLAHLPSRTAVRWVLRSVVSEGGTGPRAIARLKAALAVDAILPHLAEDERVRLHNVLDEEGDLTGEDAALMAARKVNPPVRVFPPMTVVPLCEVPRMSGRLLCRVRRGESAAYLCVSEGFEPERPGGQVVPGDTLLLAATGDDMALLRLAWRQWRRRGGSRVRTAALAGAAVAAVVVAHAFSIAACALSGLAAYHVGSAVIESLWQGDRWYAWSNGLVLILLGLMAGIVALMVPPSLAALGRLLNTAWGACTRPPAWPVAAARRSPSRPGSFLVRFAVRAPLPVVWLACLSTCGGQFLAVADVLSRAGDWTASWVLVLLIWISALVAGGILVGLVIRGTIRFAELAGALAGLAAGDRGGDRC